LDDNETANTKADIAAVVVLVIVVVLVLVVPFRQFL